MVDFTGICGEADCDTFVIIVLPLQLRKKVNCRRTKSKLLYENEDSDDDTTICGEGAPPSVGELSSQFVWP